MQLPGYIVGSSSVYQLDLNNNGKLLYEASPYSPQYIINTKPGNIAGTVPIPGNALEVALAPHSNQAWYSLYNGAGNVSLNAVAVVDTDTNTTLTTIAAGNQPQYISFSPDGRFAYVVAEASNWVAVIDTETLSVVRTISVGNLPIGIAITHVSHAGGN
jgi:YVTN family beta-propeller protein